MADPDRYARAMLGYCQALERRVGCPPDVLGIQNERTQPADTWHKMTLALRRRLDEAGFSAVKLHMSDHGVLAGGIRNARILRASKPAWEAIDFAATHMYDYQDYFTDPDGFDSRLAQWKQLTGDKPFLSTELCINRPSYQRDEYRLALTMGQLYHKNLALVDAVAICYCWTLLNVEQPSYGATRSLFVPDRGHGFVPTPSSYQLRVLGAYSRRIKQGMVRLGAHSSSEDLLAVAFAGETGGRTVVLLNRGVSPALVRVEPFQGTFSSLEVCDPYRENEVRAAPTGAAEKPAEITVNPGAIVTLSTAALGTLPDGFLAGLSRMR